MKPGMSKRGLRGASLAQLEKNLAEAFAILDTMGISKEVRHTVAFIQSDTMFCLVARLKLREPAWAVDSYSSGPPAGGNSQNLISKTLRMTG